MSKRKHCGIKLKTSDKKLRKNHKQKKVKKSREERLQEKMNKVRFFDTLAWLAGTGPYGQ